MLHTILVLVDTINECHSAACRGAPLPSIAKWMSVLFGNVDLSPSDLTEAVVLTAASQSLRRKMRIKKALAPVIAKAGSVVSAATSDTESVPDGDSPASLAPSLRPPAL